MKINKNLSFNNLKASVSSKTNIPQSEFKLYINRKYPAGDELLKDSELTDYAIIEMKFQLKGG